MSIRFQKIIFLRFAILALLAGFSVFSFAGFVVNNNNAAYVTGQCFATQQDACAAAVYPGSTYHYTGAVSGTNNLYCNVYNNSNNAQNGVTVMGTCSMTCPSGQVRVNGICNAPPTCPSGKQYSSTTGECEWITSCPAGQSLLTTASSGGTVTSAQCVPQSGNNFPCDTYARMQSSYCQGQRDSCTASGGTFGNVAGSNVCIPAGNGLPNCESGGTQYVTNPDGSKTPTCVGTSNIGDPNSLPKGTEGGKTASTPEQESAAATANNTAEIARINNAGFQGVVNAINNLAGKTTAAGGGSGSSAAQDQQNSQGIIDAINSAKNSEHGAGECDPHAKNYYECLGLTEEKPSENDLKNGATSAVEGSLDNAKDTVISAINDRGEIQSPSEFNSSFLSKLPQPVACSSLSITSSKWSFQITCDETEIIRQWFAWVIAIFTLFYIRDIALSPRSA